MDETDAEILTSLADIAVLAVICGAIGSWVLILRRVLQRRPLVSFEPRRPVPWNGLDLLVVLLAYVSLGASLTLAAYGLLGWDFQELGAKPSTAMQSRSDDDPASEAKIAVAKENDNQEIDLDRAHPIVVLLSGDASPGTVLLCLIAVIVIAPLAEEFFFRLLLQGYFEKADFACRRVWRYSGRLLGFMPILVSSLLFAALHSRGAEPPRPVESLIHLFTIDSLTKVLLVAGAIVYLRLVRRATWDDLGLRFDRFWNDAGLALAALLAVIVPIYLLQEWLGRLLPGTVPDPVPLFFFAVTLGYLYFRTHRLVPSILLHLVFNATALAMFFAVTSR